LTTLELTVTSGKDGTAEDENVLVGQDRRWCAVVAEFAEVVELEKRRSGDELAVADAGE
jgi:hypothetical protein